MTTVPIMIHDALTQSSRNRIRMLIALFGISLPYLARLPGMALYGVGWGKQLADGGVEGFCFLQNFNAVLWGGIVLATLLYRHARSFAFPAVIGFALPFYWYATLDLASSSTAGVALVAIPLEALPMVIVGFLLGLWFDRKHYLRNSGDRS